MLRNCIPMTMIYNVLSNKAHTYNVHVVELFLSHLSWRDSSVGQHRWICTNACSWLTVFDHATDWVLPNTYKCLMTRQMFGWRLWCTYMYVGLHGNQLHVQHKWQYGTTEAEQIRTLWKRSLQVTYIHYPSSMESSYSTVLYREVE
jgi:hypothetical protein